MSTKSTILSYKDALLLQRSSVGQKSGTSESAGINGNGDAESNGRNGILRIEQGALNATTSDIHVPFARRGKRPTKEVQLFDYFTVAATTAKKQQVSTKPPPVIERHPSKKNLPRGNVLDKDAPELHKGKTREGQKRPTKTKKTILEGREVRETETSCPETEPFSSKFRSYCEYRPTKELDASVLEFLAEIKRFQDRLWAKDPVKGHIKRRLVCGLRECHKQIDLRNAKCLIIATNIERIPIEGGLDDQIGTLCAACREQELPVVFALTKNKLGRVVKKSCVSCVAVLNYQGADNQYKTMLEELSKCKDAKQPECDQATPSEDATDAEFLDRGIAAMSLVREEEQEQEEGTFPNQQNPQQLMASMAPVNPLPYSVPYPVDFSHLSDNPSGAYQYAYHQPVPYIGSDGAMYFMPYEPYGRPDGYSYAAAPPPFPYNASSYPPYDSQPHNRQV